MTFALSNDIIACDRLMAERVVERGPHDIPLWSRFVFVLSTLRWIPQGNLDFSQIPAYSKVSIIHTGPIIRTVWKNFLDFYLFVWCDPNFFYYIKEYIPSKTVHSANTEPKLSFIVLLLTLFPLLAYEIFKKNSLFSFILSCSIINFQKNFHPACLFHPPLLFDTWE